MPIIYLVPFLLATYTPIPEKDPKEFFELQGKLIDASSMQPIANAHIFWSTHKTISNEKGDFSIRVKAGISLQISHIGYEKTSYIVDSVTSSPVIIFLLPSAVELDEVVVRTLPSEQSFKQQVITANPAFHLQEERLKSNVNFIKNIHHLSYHYDMNSYDKLLSGLSDKGSTVLFSSNPSMGILGLIRRLKQKRNLPSKTRVSNPSPRLLYPYMRKKEGYQKYFE
tara:strand:- start:3032 stop:3706 length:675 start_codon:yes stop_codon:yes gene_type:complete